MLWVDRLAYQGTDIVFDEEIGPMILEINAQPGLNIQIANQSGLLSQLMVLERRYHELVSVEDRIRFAMDYFESMA